MLLNPETESDALDDVSMEVLPPESELPSGIGDVLAMCGLANQKDAEDDNVENHLQATLKRNNAGVDAAARQLGSLLVSADSDAVKLNAAKMIMQLHGHLNADAEDGGKKGPIFNITIVGKQQQNILNVLIPSQT